MSNNKHIYTCYIHIRYNIDTFHVLYSYFVCDGDTVKIKYTIHDKTFRNKKISNQIAAHRADGTTAPQSCQDFLQDQRLPSHSHHPGVTHLDVPGPGSERINGEVGSMGNFTDPYKWGMNWGYNLLILTFY